MIDSSEKQGGSGFNDIQAREFRECISNCCLFDSGFTGPKFTWFRGRLKERLDRSLCNDKWIQSFPRSSTLHLERLKSDHRPIIVRTDSTPNQVHVSRPFRFNAAWLTHDLFDSFLDHQWEAGKDVCSSLQAFGADCQRWNKDTFGHILKRKKSLQRRLQELEQQSRNSLTLNSAKEEEDVRTELEKTLWQEEILWMQKSRIKWLKDGDRNTKFFHLSTLRRREFNRIKGLRNDDGQWVYDDSQLQKLATDFFKKLFGRGNTTPFDDDVALFPTPLTPEDSRCLGDIPSHAEIVAALKAMGGLKAPGKDGFHPIFFQSCWSKVGKDVSNFVSDCFRNPELIAKANETIIVLIPKTAKPERISQFRPISLCNVVYKTIAKCIADRLKKHMATLTDVTQTSFVPGRHISDNIVILQEVVHSMRTKKGSTGWMTIKLDLAKAFDRLEWCFVADTLTKANLPPHLITVIMACISSVSTQVLWNGGLTDIITPGRGLRQGCPLSPFLFTLCIERLSILISNAVSNGNWKQIHLVKEGPGLSHLFFADDLVLFGMVNPNQCHSIRNCLDTFCKASGQLVSKDKSRIFFSANVNKASRRHVCRELGFAETNDLGRYLGVPVLHGRINKGTHKYLIERIDKKLEGWKRNTLSLAGRVTLASSVLNSIPAYAMQTTLLPASITKDIDARIRNFVWGSTNDKRKTHLISWDVVCRPKSEGGLGLKKEKELNEAFMMKLGWLILKAPEKLWVNILTSKYLKNSDQGMQLRRKTGGSNLWRGIRKTWTTMAAACQHSIRDGSSTLFWHHRWLDSGDRLADHALQPIDPVENDRTVADVVTALGDWDWNHLRAHLSPAHLEQIAGMGPPPPKLAAVMTI
ncbi:LINE-1 retrotransposable element ORF2 protein [Linum perenne]